MLTGEKKLNRLKRFSIRMKNDPTPAERILRKALKENNIPYRFQKVIPPYIVDFFLFRKSLIIELDGGHHINKLNQMDYDTNRDSHLMSLGLKVLRFENNIIIDNPLKIIEIYNSCPNLMSANKIAHYTALWEKCQEIEWNAKIEKFFIRYFRGYLDRIWYQRYKTYKKGMTLSDMLPGRKEFSGFYWKNQ